MTGTILIIDDEASIRRLLTTLLKKDSYRVIAAPDGPAGLALAAQTKPDLIILDLFMPGLSGHEVCIKIRATPDLKNIPIMILTAHNTDGQTATSLDHGADDYLAKPFDLREFRARVRALLRRPRTYAPQEMIHREGLVLDVRAHHILWKGRELRLAPKEFDLLSRLVRESPRVISKKELAESVWETTLEQLHHRTMDVHVHRIRQKLGVRGMRRLKTIPVLGYQWVDKSTS